MWGGVPGRRLGFFFSRADSRGFQGSGRWTMNPRVARRAQGNMVGGPNSSESDVAYPSEFFKSNYVTDFRASSDMKSRKNRARARMSLPCSNNFCMPTLHPQETRVRVRGGGWLGIAAVRLDRVFCYPRVSGV